MARVALVLCVLAGAVLGMMAGAEPASAPTAMSQQSARLRDEVDRLRVRFADVQRDLDAAATPAAATAARAKLFQLRVDMVAIEDELEVLAGRSPVARDL